MNSKECIEVAKWLADLSRSRKHKTLEAKLQAIDLAITIYLVATIKERSEPTNGKNGVRKKSNILRMPPLRD